MWLTILLGAIVVILAFIVFFLTRHYGKLENCGFPVIKPFLFFGSGPFNYHETNLVQIDMERSEKYGKIFGAYILSSPWVFVADPEIIKQMTIKDFEHFPAHQFQFQNQKYRSLDSTSGAEWKELRKGMSPAFTSGKLKSMIKLIDGALDNMINYLQKEVKKNPVIDMRPVLQSFTMDSIGLCAMAVNLNCFDDPNNPIFKAARDAFGEFRATDAMSNLQLNMELGMVGLEKYFDFVTPGVMKLWEYSKQIQTSREKSGERHGDFVDQLADLKEAITKTGIITEDQLTAQIMIFFLAGFETTAHSMGALCYLLSKNPEAYERLEEEVDSIDAETFDHDTIAELPYLEGCIKEAMRIIPAVGRNDRKCEKDWEYKGYKIKKGTCIGLMNYVIHHNPEYWPEPELFRPERFLKENAGNIVPCSFLTFGSGPRACIGERFAMVEMKVAMAKLLQNFHIESTDETKLTFNKGDIFQCSYENVMVKLVPRK
eukprot:TRINITY_DN1687_c0_g1_i12.p1 TRINITY_DN1687_c0_g1~~TRINITY_DN1687_c0_g1_i12.p1  ORF type:complete len:486 (-),score=141.78 TRINITY_DN1687_c0_g1_i12:488-1945(-)